MRVTKDSIDGSTERSILADVSARQIGGAGGVGGQDGQASVGAEAARRFRNGRRSKDFTLPPVARSMRAAVASEHPFALKRNFRTNSGEMPPMETAITSSLTPFTRMKSDNSISATFPAPPRVPAELPTARLTEALAVIVSEVVLALPIADREGTLVRVANRLDDLGRLPGGSEAAGLLGAVASVMMRMEP